MRKELIWMPDVRRVLRARNRLDQTSIVAKNGQLPGVPNVKKSFESLRWIRHLRRKVRMKSESHAAGIRRRDWQQRGLRNRQSRTCANCVRAPRRRAIIKRNYDI